MKSLLRKPVLSVIGAIMMVALTAAPGLAQFDTEYDPGTPAFQRTWDRTDKPVADGVISRTWNWGPGRTEVMMEEYAEAPDGMRQVQYFDKSRMEITNPDAEDDGLWYVTNGLLVVEMVTGMMQIGDSDFESRSPADVNIVGDPGNAFSPTYADIARYGLQEEPADAEGASITRTLSEDGESVDDPSYARYGVTAAEQVTVPGINHTVAAPFWEFMNSSGPVWEDGQVVTDDLFPNPYYATGFPITEAYWTTAPVGGTSVDVLWQCFERRCLTYTPGNDEGFQVEAGNVGQHYWTWRYGQQEPANYDGSYYAELEQFNDSGVSGTATLSLDGDQLTVMIEASGLTPDMEHLQHIHGFGAATEMSGLQGVTDSTCFDSDAYGPVLLALEPYPTADTDGNLSYSQTLTVDPDELGDPTLRAIVIHGMIVDGEYNVGIPVACGEIEEGEAPEPPENFDGDYYADLLSFNDSGVTGTASLTLDGDQLTVQIEASGLTPDQQHLQHIHGFGDDAEMSGMLGAMESTCFDADAYGPVLIALEPYPTADAEGNLSYSETLTIDPDMLLDPTQRAIVIHGMDVDGEYNAGIPVACGEIEAGEAPEPPAEQDYVMVFGELNNSGVTAFGSATLTGDQLTVSITASGLAADQVHPQHIHGQEDGWSFCPGPDFDSDGNGTVEIGEGVPAYGGVVQPLFVDVEAEEYPTADNEGNLSFEMTYTVDAETVGDLADRVVVLHGMDVDGTYDATQPVACALIVPDGLDAYSADDLSGANQRPDPVESDGSGNAWFMYDEEGEALYYMLSVWNLEDVTAAHIHEGGVDDTGGVVAPLFLTEEDESFAAFGILSSGRITAGDLPDDMTLADLVALFGDGEMESDAYVNVHTVTYPPGELRDQVNTLIAIE